VTHSLLRSRPLAALLAVTGLVALYWGALSAGFLNDDYLFLEDARARGLGALLAPSGALANYFRPLSRELWFGALTALGGGHPLVFHLASFAVLLVALALLFDLLRAFSSAPDATIGVLWFALLPLQRVNLIWISCSQDLLALVFTLGTIALFRRGRDRLAVLAYLGAVLSKQSALPLPILLGFWCVRLEGASLRAALRRVAPFALPVLLWALGETRLRASAPAAAVLEFSPGALAAAFAHLAQSLLGLEQPGGLIAGLKRAGPSVGAFVLLAPLAAWHPEAALEDGRRRAGALTFATLWLVAFAVPVWPVAYCWSAYFYTTAAVGGAVLVAVAATRIRPWGLLPLAMALLWWHGAVSAAPTFAVERNPWTATSHLTNWYFERGAALSAKLRAALRRVAPGPEHGTRFFFATIPPYAGFQMGNGAAIRELYRDPTLESWFYSQFGDSTAADHPCVFLFWNGEDFERLYAAGRDPFFQVGGDLLLLERPAGAVHAFHRGLAAGETRVDHLYWLGWALLWTGDRSGAESAWTAFGAKDDSTLYRVWLDGAETALAQGDTLAARRDLFQSTRAGIGRPEAHALLAPLLRTRSTKFALLEAKVAVYLAPGDWRARRDLSEGLVAARLDEPARHALESLKRIYPEWASDSLVVRLERTLGERDPLGDSRGAARGNRRGDQP
jgi:hypothetical protein